INHFATAAVIVGQSRQARNHDHEHALRWRNRTGSVQDRNRERVHEVRQVFLLLPSQGQLWFHRVRGPQGGQGGHAAHSRDEVQR
ncbi:unnamed protein product, partial [Laminaria digitata]